MFAFVEKRTLFLKSRDQITEMQLLLNDSIGLIHNQWLNVLHNIYG